MSGDDERKGFWIVVGVMVAIFAVIAVAVIILPGQQARRRGYHPVVWALAGLFTFNPISVLVLLGLVPHKSRLRLRETFEAELDAKLATAGDRGPGAGPAGGVVRDRSIGDAATEAPTRSIGDQMTQLPQRSIGDDHTTL